MASLSRNNVVHVALVPNDNVGDKASDQSIGQESNSEHAGDEDDGNSGALLGADAEDGPGRRETQVWRVEYERENEEKSLVSIWLCSCNTQSKSSDRETGNTR